MEGTLVTYTYHIPETSPKDVTPTAIQGGFENVPDGWELVDCRISNPASSGVQQFSDALSSALGSGSTR